MADPQRRAATVVGRIHPEPLVPEATTIDPRTTVGTVRLVVADIAGTGRFYQRVLGLRELRCDGDSVALGVDGAALVELTGRPDAPPRPARSTGLFHLAILVPGRPELARALHRMIGAGWRLSGASDHLVSEALYLRDPEGNGIEIYRDRPRERWYAEGRVRMATLPLDLDGLARESGPPPSGADGMPPEARVGHVHLQVADLAETDAFYRGILGFEVTVRDYPGALFFSAGGYHHRVGANTWAGAGAPPPPAGSAGLSSFDVVLPSAEEVERVAARARDTGFPAEPVEGGVRTRDPSGNSLVLTASG
jgi:catechol 2,3-dioxygenase